MPDLYARYRFFKEHAGYIVGRRAECALSLARAEALFDRADELGVARIEWEYDDEPYDPGDVCTEDEERAKFESNEWTGPFGCVLTIGEDPYEHVESLWGIVVGQAGIRDPYCRVVAAELALAAESELRQAIGDVLDRAEEVCFA